MSLLMMSSMAMGKYFVIALVVFAATVQIYFTYEFGLFNMAIGSMFGFLV
jgi:hypothetical protein